MCRLLIFGGTTEGRELAAFCAENGLSAVVSVATAYGAALLSGVRVITGRMTEAQMLEFITENRFSLVIDATHPFAREATENIRRACEKAGVRRLRVLREASPEADALYFDAVAELVAYLSEREGAVLVTTGSKELDAFLSLPNYRGRCAVRVLPSAAERCLALGFASERIIVGKGPFTKEQNVGHMKKYGARFLVTKDSGAAGGFGEKLAAARELGARALVLKRPEEEGVTLEEAKKILLEERP